MYCHRNFIQALAAALTVQVLQAKYQKREVRLADNPTDPASQWRYVSKFGYSIGKGVSSVRARLKDPDPTHSHGFIPLKVEVYLDEEWPAAEAMDDICARRDKSRMVSNMNVFRDGSWADWSNNTHHQSIRPHIWFFAISACHGVLTGKSHGVVVEFLFVQEDGSEFSYESRWALTTNVLALAVFGVFSISFCQRCGKFRQSNGSLHPVITALGAAILLQLAGHISHTWHLWAYSGDGVGLLWVEVLSEVFFMLSQVLLASLLITIAMGYTLTRSRVGDLDVIMVSSVLVALVHVALLISHRCRDDDAWKFHEHEGAHGWFMFALRLALWAVFVWGVRATGAGAGTALQSFLSGYLCVGSAYFLSYPVVFLVVRIFAAYLQNAILQAGLASVQVASVAWLASLFLSRGAYFKVSSLNSSELPQRSRSAEGLLPSSWTTQLRGLLGVMKKAT